MLMLAGSFFLMIFLQNMGILYPADAKAQAYLEAVPMVQKMTAEDFDEAALPDLCRYVLFESRDEDADILCSNMDERQLAAALNAWKGGRGNPGYTRYHAAVGLEDGAVCYFQYDYAVAYVNPALQKRLPDFQISYFGAVLLIMLFGVWLITRHYTGLLARETSLLTKAGERIARRKTWEEPQKAAVREFQEALAALEKLQGELEESLQQQWRMEQERRENIAALSHDLKTPLSVIGGNAELLEEDELNGEQAVCVEAILRNVAYAQDYVERLRQITFSQDYVERLHRSSFSQDDAEGARRSSFSQDDVEGVRQSSFSQDDAEGVRQGSFSQDDAGGVRQSSFSQGINKEEKQELSLRAFYEECCKSGEMLCSPKRILLQRETAADIRFFACREELRRALVNVFENAVRYTPEGKRIVFSVSEEQGTLCFAVRDNGPGFSPEALQKAGQMLYTSDSARAREGHQGMGLYFAAQAAQRHGGALEVYNTEEGGCVCLRIRIGQF